MDLLLAVVGILAALPVVTGGSDTQRKTVEDVLKKVPDCLRSFDGKTPAVTIVKSGALNASYNSATDSLQIHDSLLDPATREKAVEELARDHCTPQKTVKMFDDPARVVVHELARYYFLHNLTQPLDAQHRVVVARANKFLDSRYRIAFKSWWKSKEREKKAKDLNNVLLLEQSLRMKGKTIPEHVSKLKCLLHEMLQSDYSGMPSRFPNDRHVLDEGSGGSEYFAVAIETMLFDPDVFCGTFSASEQAWLMNEMGKCLSKLMRGSPCKEENSSPLPAGTAR